MRLFVFAVQSQHLPPVRSICPARGPVLHETKMTKPPKIPESVLVVIYTPDLDVLVIKRADQPDFWQSVTGSKDALDEPLALTAAREVVEETGIAVGTPDVPASALVDWRHKIEYTIYPQYLHRYAPGVTRNVEHWFGLCVPHRVDVTLSPREHVDHAWLPFREAAARAALAVERRGDPATARARGTVARAARLVRMTAEARSASRNCGRCSCRNAVPRRGSPSRRAIPCDCARPAASSSGR